MRSEHPYLCCRHLNPLPWLLRSPQCRDRYGGGGGFSQPQVELRLSLKEL